MALTGYMYTSLEDIQDVLEDGKTGSTATLCSELARKMKCWVIAGFPEKVDDQVGVKEDETDNAGQDDGNDVDVDTIPEAQNLATAPGSTVSLSSEEFKGTAYNSAVIVSPSGTVYDTYRKSFLFETDKAWAKEGQCLWNSIPSWRVHPS
jgi:protein N-terminal amidase